MGSKEEGSQRAQKRARGRQRRELILGKGCVLGAMGEAGGLSTGFLFCFSLQELRVGPGGADAVAVEPRAWKSRGARAKLQFRTKPRAFRGPRGARGGGRSPPENPAPGPRLCPTCPRSRPRNAADTGRGRLGTPGGPAFLLVCTPRPPRGTCLIGAGGRGEA